MKQSTCSSLNRINKGLLHALLSLCFGFSLTACEEKEVGVVHQPDESRNVYNDYCRGGRQIRVMRERYIARIYQPSKAFFDEAQKQAAKSASEIREDAKYHFARFRGDDERKWRHGSPVTAESHDWDYLRYYYVPALSPGIISVVAQERSKLWKSYALNKTTVKETVLEGDPNALLFEISLDLSGFCASAKHVNDFATSDLLPPLSPELRKQMQERERQDEIELAKQVEFLSSPEKVRAKMVEDERQAELKLEAKRHYPWVLFLGIGARSATITDVAGSAGVAFSLTGKKWINPHLGIQLSLNYFWYGHSDSASPQDIAAYPYNFNGIDISGALPVALYSSDRTKIYLGPELTYAYDEYEGVGVRKYDPNCGYAGGCYGYETPASLNRSYFSYGILLGADMYVNKFGFNLRLSRPSLSDGKLSGMLNFGFSYRF